ncbi:carbohydrate esterase family 1 protein [Zopfia rhizophila CBS 207.26]|uniref:feruloyl esterase n=1 Tax=Zopfia rhizophila CBS 207.26 TaxID=1314779 RepID=A0A6A6DTF2_9PEZI|nr:carbohydrate esterase family 1 protein [Zopfia rhizophila CBS 207.26]
MLFSFVLGAILFSFVGSAAPSKTEQRSDGCGKPLPSVVVRGNSKNLTINSRKRERKYRIHVPELYQTDVPVPLILSFHGRNKGMKFQEDLSQFSNASYGFEAIAVYPEGFEEASHPKQWQGDPNAPEDIDDIGFTLDLIDHLLGRYCLDPARVYAAGKSNGGGITGLLTCDPKATEKIAAFAAVSGAFYLNREGGELPACNPIKSRDIIPITDFHGEKDNTILCGGRTNERNNSFIISVPTYVNQWAERDGFDANSNVTTTLCGTGAKEVTRYSWDDTVIHYKYKNLFHDWPSTFPNSDTNLTTCTDAEPTRVILDWFKKWSL